MVWLGCDKHVRIFIVHIGNMYVMKGKKQHIMHFELLIESVIQFFLSVVVVYWEYFLYFFFVFNAKNFTARNIIFQTEFGAVLNMSSCLNNFFIFFFVFLFLISIYKFKDYFNKMLIIIKKPVFYQRKNKTSWWMRISNLNTPLAIIKDCLPNGLQNRTLKRLSVCRNTL